jgi:lysozyme family protein
MSGDAPGMGKAIAGFTGAVALVLGALFAVEGGHVNDKHDAGGETNHGITKQIAVESGHTAPMRDLTKDQAARIYVSQYIDKPGFRPLLERDAAVGEELVDTGVNAGPGREARWLQETLNHLNNGGADYPDIVEDGRVGSATVAAFDSLRRRRGNPLACQLVVKLLDAKQAAHYMRLGGRNGYGERYMVGWVRTRIGNIDLARCGKVAA